MLEIVKLSTTKTYKKGEIIFHEGDPLEYLYIIHQGHVKIYQLFESGKEQLLRILYPGEFMGEHALFSEKVMDSYAEAMEETEICAIHRKDMQNLMQSHPTINMKILEQFSIRLDQSEKLTGQLSVKDVETRTASYLIGLASDNNSNDIVLPMSKKDLASLSRYYTGDNQQKVI
ncbi:Crp/Fnr family transcriptional regulator [Virgibacillus byunsanensis]|uniref:Crp/Fnr family transcriptional regulator n=1 Tax=Virgibacillus byunsanensis TaxID=570945 RepID=A0ABW3LM52_9BACI